MCCEITAVGSSPTNGGLPGDQLVEHRAERVEVGLRRGLAAERLLRRHVGDGADHHPVLREARAVERDREPEVADLGDAVRGQPDVARLEVAVHDALRVREGEAARRRPSRSRACAPAAARPPPSRSALDIAAAHELGDDVGCAALLADVEDGDDVCGCAPRRPIACASRMMRSRPTSSRPSVLIRAKATSRSSGSSCARKTRFLPAFAEEAAHVVAAGDERLGQ